MAVAHFTTCICFANRWLVTCQETHDIVHSRLLFSFQVVGKRAAENELSSKAKMAAIEVPVDNVRVKSWYRLCLHQFSSQLFFLLLLYYRDSGNTRFLESTFFKFFFIIRCWSIWRFEHQVFQTQVFQAILIPTSMHFNGKDALHKVHPYHWLQHFILLLFWHRLLHIASRLHRYLSCAFTAHLYRFSLSRYLVYVSNAPWVITDGGNSMQHRALHTRESCSVSKFHE